MEMLELGSTTGGTKLWSCTCEPMAGGDVPGMQDSDWTSGQDAGGRVSGSCTCQVTQLDVVEHKVGSTTHLILLGSLLLANAAVTSCALVFVYGCRPLGLLGKKEEEQINVVCFVNEN
jgi:hypothetical protein